MTWNVFGSVLRPAALTVAVGLLAFGCDKDKAPEATPATKPETKQETNSDEEPESEAPTADTTGGEPPARLREIEYEHLENDDDVHAVLTKDVGSAGAGYRIEGLAEQGWSQMAGEGGAFALSGPPGGPLGFELRPYGPGDAEMPLDELFTAWTGAVADVSAEPIQISLAGAKRDAQAFRSGESLATTASCMVRVPSGRADAGGWWLRFYTGGAQTQAPSCDMVTSHAALAPIAKSFGLVP